MKTYPLTSLLLSLALIAMFGCKQADEKPNEGQDKEESAKAESEKEQKDKKEQAPDKLAGEKDKKGSDDGSGEPREDADQPVVEEDDPQNDDVETKEDAKAFRKQEEAEDKGASDETALPDSQTEFMRMIAVMPQDASLVGVMAVGDMLNQSLDQVARLVGTYGKDEETRKKIGAYLQKRLGINPFDLNYVSFFVSNNTGGFIIHKRLAFPENVEKTEKVGDFELARTDGNMWMALLDDATVGGDEQAVRAVLACKRGESKSLKEVFQKRHMKSTLDALGNGHLIILADADMLQKLELDLPEGVEIQSAGVRAAFSAQGGLKVVAKAPEMVRSTLLRQLKGLKQAIQSQITMKIPNIDEMDPFVAIGLIYADKHLDDMYNKLAPKEEGEFLVLELEGLAGMPAFYLVGVMGAVAIPAFIKYIRKSKVSEAVMHLEQITQLAVAHYQTPRVNKQGDLMPREFPPSAGVTPKEGTCCAALGGPDKNDDGKCDADPARFDKPGWKALEFRIDGPHHCVYEFKSEGKGNNARFKAIAHCDLDCDGVQSTFERKGRIREDGSIDTKQLYVENELE